MVAACLKGDARTGARHVVNAQADAPTGGPRFQTVGSQGREQADKDPYAGNSAPATTRAAIDNCCGGRRKLVPPIGSRKEPLQSKGSPEVGRLTLAICPGENRWSMLQEVAGSNPAPCSVVNSQADAIVMLAIVGEAIPQMSRRGRNGWTR